MLRQVFCGAVMLLSTLLAGCSPSKATGANGIAIYLTTQPLNGAQILQADVTGIKLQPEAIIRPEDILSYNARSHEMKLSPEAVERIAALKVPMNGLGFVVTANGQPVYGGAFWSYLSSLSYEGIVINTPLLDPENTATIGWGYPGMGSGPANDPRSDPRVLDALRQAGVLVEPAQ